MSFNNMPYIPGGQWERPGLGSPAGAIATERWSGVSIVDTGMGFTAQSPQQLNTLSTTSTAFSSAVDGTSLLGGNLIGSGVGAIGRGLGTVSDTIGVINGLQADGNRFGPNTASAVGTMAICGPLARSAAVSGCELGMTAGANAGPIGAGVGCLVGGVAAGVGAYKTCEQGVNTVVNSAFK